MKSPPWNIAEAIAREADRYKGYSQLAKRINATQKGGLRLLDRRKLKAIAENKAFTISTHELVALDTYFAPRGEGFCDRPLFAWHGMLEDMAENDRLLVLMGAFQRSVEERNDVSLWDVHAFQEVLAGMHRFREVIHDRLQDVPFFNPGGKHNRNLDSVHDLLGKSKQSVCSIGSTRANVASELLLAEMFGVKAFAEPAHALPFAFFWSDDKEHKKAGFTSAFTARPADFPRIEAALAKCPSAWRRVGALILQGGTVLPVITKSNAPWDDYGVVVAQRSAHQRIRMVIAGLTGPSTYAAAQACRLAISTAIPAHPPGDVLIATVRASIGPGHDTIGDARKVESVELLGEPKIWSNSSR